MTYTLYIGYGKKKVFETKAAAIEYVYKENKKQNEAKEFENISYEEVAK